MSRKKKKSARRPTLGQSPLDSLLSVPGGSTAKKRGTRSSSSAKAREEAEEPKETEVVTEKKVRATFHLPYDLVEECRNAVVWLASPPERLTMARLAENALRRELDRLRKKHTNGKEFPARSEDLRGGRPIGS